MSTSPMVLVVLLGILLVLLVVPVMVLVGAMRGGAWLPRIVKFVSVAVVFGTVLVVGVQVAEIASGSPVTITVPVETADLKIPAGVIFEPPLEATIEQGGFSQVRVVAHGFSPATQWALIGGLFLSGATVIAICVVVLRLSNGLAAADPFALGAQALTTLGWIVMIGWTAASVVGQVGDVLAAQDLFGYTGATLPANWRPDDSLLERGWPVPGNLGFNFPLEPLGAALLLALLAAVFRHGERLRHDTEGLV